MELTVEVLVLGGGATGTAIARDLALRGVSVCLLERDDLASGATGHYHGLLHSGARYVTTDPATARDCAAENATLRRIAPHCIADTGGLFLVLDPRAELLYQPVFVQGLQEAGIEYETLEHSAVVREEPLVAPNVRRAFRVNDAVLDSWRYCVANVLDAQDHGAWAFRGVRVDRVHLDDDRVTGASGFNSITAQPYDVRASQVVNATGAWAAATAALARIELPLAPQKGTLVALAHRPATHVLNHCRPPSDGDILVPDGASAIIGTTAVAATGPDDTSVPDGDVARLVDAGVLLAPVLREIPVTRSWAAVRPLLIAEPMRESAHGQQGGHGRDYLIVDHESRDGIGGFITIVGGMVTTSRLMAEAVSDLVCRKLALFAPCRTAELALPGAGEPRGSR